MSKVQKKLKVLSNEDTYEVMMDLLRSFDKETYGACATDDYYKIHISRLKYKYEQEIPKEPTNVVQLDLEDAIKEVKGE